MINAPRKRAILMRDRSNWFQVCSSLDVIEDTNLAIDAYVDGRIVSTVDGHAYGTEYLAIYGLLQSLFVQQDAVNNLHQALGIPFSINDHDMLRSIRKLRNSSIGHPTRQDRPKQDPITSNFISRHSIYRGGFTLLSSSNSNYPVFNNINLFSLVATQRKSISNILEELSTALSHELDPHKEAFRLAKLQDTLPPSLSHAFEKIDQAVRRREPVELGLYGINTVKQALRDFEDALRRRGIEVDTYDRIKYLLEDLEYPLEQLNLFLQGSTSDIVNTTLASIVASFVRQYVYELAFLAKELDDEYESPDAIV